MVFCPSLFLDLLDSSRWTTNNDAPSRNITGHNCAGTDDCVFANCHTRQYNCTCTNQYVVMDFDATAQRRSRSQMNSVSQTTFVINGRAMINDASFSDSGIG